MPVIVHDFYTRHPLNTNGLNRLVMANALFYVLATVRGKIKELKVQVPKKFHYNAILKRGNFIAHKATEYNVLVDFLKDNSDSFMEKWNLNNKEFNELLRGIYLILVSQYSVIPPFLKRILEAKAYLEVLLDKGIRRFKKCFQD